MILISKKQDHIHEALISSSNILKVIYNEQLQRLYVYFKSGKGYSYAPVQPVLFGEFLRANSQGRFINQRLIKDNTIKATYEHKLYDYEIMEINQAIEAKLRENGKV